MSRLPTQFVELLMDAVLKSFWKRKGLRRFLRRSGVSERTLASWHEEETKREWLARLVPAMEEKYRGRQMLQQMARDLAEQTEFPDLRGWEESEHMVREARHSVAALARYLRDHETKKADAAERERFRKEARKRQEATIRSKTSLEALEARLNALCQRLGTAEGGREFQDWFYDLVAFFEHDHRRPYRVGPREIDGAVTVDGTTYLVELKFTTGRVEAPEVDVFHSKVSRNADNTMGVMVAPAGFTSAAVREASRERSPIILMQWEHIMVVLKMNFTFEEVVLRIRRHASQTGEALLLPKDF